MVKVKRSQSGLQVRITISTILQTGNNSELLSVSDLIYCIRQTCNANNLISTKSIFLIPLGGKCGCTQGRHALIIFEGARVGGVHHVTHSIHNSTYILFIFSFLFETFPNALTIS